MLNAPSMPVVPGRRAHVPLTRLKSRCTPGWWETVGSAQVRCGGADAQLLGLTGIERGRERRVDLDLDLRQAELLGEQVAGGGRRRW